jgi:antitoxin (DNA-binding transcriptional repressor) of toxin-antitoxin stability system
MKIQIINISELKSRFSEYLSRTENGERFLILRRARPLAARIRVGDLQHLERSPEVIRRLAQTLGQSPKLIEHLKTGRVHPMMDAFGQWKDEDDLGGLGKQIMISRQQLHPRHNS